jgi:hypothetical protein
MLWHASPDRDTRHDRRSPFPCPVTSANHLLNPQFTIRPWNGTAATTKPPSKTCRRRSPNGLSVLVFQTRRRGPAGRPSVMRVARSGDACHNMRGDQAATCGEIGPQHAERSGRNMRRDRATTCGETRATTCEETRPQHAERSGHNMRRDRATTTSALSGVQATAGHPCDK